jgi:hypothetical protein
MVVSFEKIIILYIILYYIILYYIILYYIILYYIILYYIILYYAFHIYFNRCIRTQVLSIRVHPELLAWPRRSTAHGTIH